MCYECSSVRGEGQLEDILLLLRWHLRDPPALRSPSPHSAARPPNSSHCPVTVSQSAPTSLALPAEVQGHPRIPQSRFLASAPRLYSRGAFRGAEQASALSTGAQVGCAVHVAQRARNSEPLTVLELSRGGDDTPERVKRLLQACLALQPAAAAAPWPAARPPVAHRKALSALCTCSPCSTLSPSAPPKMDLHPMMNTAPGPGRGEDSIDTSVDRQPGFDEDMETQKIFGQFTRACALFASLCPVCASASAAGVRSTDTSATHRKYSLRRRQSPPCLLPPRPPP